MIYTILLLIGLFGLLAQTLLGFTHIGHAHAGHGHGGNAHGHGANTHGHGGHEGQGHGDQSRHTELHGEREHGMSPIWSLFSPLTMFSLCVGIGATGLLLHPYHWASALVAVFAALGGLMFYGMVVRPLWAFIFQFASPPSKALEGMVAQTAEALSRFDPSGKGIVRLTIDGQWVRVLAFLEPDEVQAGVSVQPGERLTVTGVDGRAGTCRVARL